MIRRCYVPEESVRTAFTPGFTDRGIMTYSALCSVHSCGQWNVERRRKRQTVSREEAETNRQMESSVVACFSWVHQWPWTGDKEKESKEGRNEAVRESVSWILTHAGAGRTGKGQNATSIGSQRPGADESSDG